MKIFVNARFLTQPVSGVQRYGIECSRQIKKLLPDTVFLAPKNILHYDIAEELDTDIIGKNTGHLWEQADLPFYLLRNGKPPLFSPANTAPLLYGNNYFTLHDLAFFHHPEWNSKAFSVWYNILVPRLALNCRHMFTVSNTVKDEIIKNYKVKPDKISVTYNGISAHMLKMEPQQKQKIILAVGTFNKRKNHQNLVKGYLAGNLTKDYQLVIIGDKNKVFAETGIDETLLTNGNIKVHDRLSSDELISMYAQAEIVVSMSLYEGFGIPILEGLYSGCKLICSDIPVYRELYDDCVTFCDPNSIEGVTTALMQVAGNVSITQCTREMLLEKFDYAQSAKTIVDEIMNPNSI
jgi:glycosyltransferase involved in cell wall biosynthesis